MTCLLREQGAQEDTKTKLRCTFGLAMADRRVLSLFRHDTPLDHCDGPVACWDQRSNNRDDPIKMNSVNTEDGKVGG